MHSAFRKLPTEPHKAESNLFSEAYAELESGIKAHPYLFGAAAVAGTTALAVETRGETTKLFQTAIKTELEAIDAPLVPKSLLSGLYDTEYVPGESERLKKLESSLTATKSEAPFLSFEATSHLFDNLASSGGELSFIKKPYTAMTCDGVPGETVVDIQNQPQFVEAGKKVVQRTMPDGKVDTYPIDQQTFLDRWQPSGNGGEYTPKPIPTRMVQLKIESPVQIQRHSGPQLGDPGDLLATDTEKSRFWTIQQQPAIDTYIGNNPQSQAVLDEIAKRLGNR